MCGRYYRRSDKQRIAEAFHLGHLPDDGEDPRLPLDLLHRFDSDKMKMVPANPAVGNWRNNGPEMLNSA
jgi:putative SOS response-associated peptidase YedK